jgi:glutathione S-transferase
MILIGQYDSPFVRRVAIALAHYKIAFEHRPWSVFGDADKIAEYNPLKRVPTVVLDSGEVLIESGVILDALDDMAGPKKALAPASGEARRAVLKVCALGAGLADKAVALVYERVLHETVSQTWIDRCVGQVGEVLNILDEDRAKGGALWWFGDSLSHADIMVGCALRFIEEAHKETFNMAQWPALTAHAIRCEDMDVFQAFQQPFVMTPPKKKS